MRDAPRMPQLPSPVRLIRRYTWTEHHTWRWGTNIPLINAVRAPSSVNAQEIVRILLAEDADPNARVRRGLRLPSTPDLRDPRDVHVQFRRTRGGYETPLLAACNSGSGTYQDYYDGRQALDIQQAALYVDKEDAHRVKVVERLLWRGATQSEYTPWRSEEDCLAVIKRVAEWPPHLWAIFNGYEHTVTMVMQYASNKHLIHGLGRSRRATTSP